MGAETLAGLAIAAIGAGTQAYAQDRTAKKATRATLDNIRTSNQKQRRADEAVAAEVAAMGASNPEAERAAATDAYLQQLRTHQASARGSSGATGGASDRFGADVADAERELELRGRQQADMLGRIAAPTRQRQNEAVNFNRLATDLGMIQREAQGDAFLNQLRMSQIRANPWVMAAGQALQGAGTAYAAGGGGGASKVRKGIKNNTIVDMPAQGFNPGFSLNGAPAAGMVS